jgi:PAS domain S-box-containing protein
MHFADLLTPAGVQTFQEYFPQFKAAGVMRDVEFDLIRKDGSSLPVLISATAVTDRGGNFLMSRSTVYDITARKRAENEIRMLARLAGGALVGGAGRSGDAGGAGAQHGLL